MSVLLACGSAGLQAAHTPGQDAPGGHPAPMERALELRSVLGTQGHLTPALIDLVAAFDAQPQPAEPAPRERLVQFLHGRGLPRDLAGIIEAYAPVPEADTWPVLNDDSLIMRFMATIDNVPLSLEDEWNVAPSSASSSESKVVPSSYWQFKVLPEPLLLCNGVATHQPVVGFGRSLHLAWPAAPEPGSHEALARIMGSGRVAFNSAGRTEFDQVMREEIDCFTYVRLSGRPGAWSFSGFSAYPIIRGMLPFAGAPEEAPGVRSGKATSARFTEPHGMARVDRPERKDPTGNRTYAVVSDPAAHGLALVTSDQEVVQHWGDPGRPGLVDGPREEALFNRPTFVASIWPLGSHQPSTSFLVADSGNHVIRLVQGDDRVTTLAGTGEPGHLDGAAGTARFRDPRGLVGLDLATCWVADRGNHVIRQIHQGVVTTVAGSPGQAGHSDGSGAEARFQDLQGLAWSRETGELFVVDGNRVRRLVADGDGLRVTTVVGAVASGFQPRPLEPLSPCLNQPLGLECSGQALYIADTGNRALRVFDLGTSELWTVAGDPAAPLGVTYGLCRDNLPFQPVEGYAGLDTPRAFLPDFPSEHRQAALTGRCITQLPLGWTKNNVRASSDYQTRMETRERDLRLAAAAEVMAGEPLALALDLVPRAGFARTGAYTYRVECVDGLGRPLLSPTGVQNEVHTGAHPFQGSLDLTESFKDAGQVTVKVTVTSQTGYSWGLEHRVDVR